MQGQIQSTLVMGQSKQLQLVAHLVADKKASCLGQWIYNSKPASLLTKVISTSAYQQSTWTDTHTHSFQGLLDNMYQLYESFPYPLHTPVNKLDQCLALISHDTHHSGRGCGQQPRQQWLVVCQCHSLAQYTIYSVASHLLWTMTCSHDSTALLVRDPRMAMGHFLPTLGESTT